MSENAVSASGSFVGAQQINGNNGLEVLMLSSRSAETSRRYTLILIVSNARMWHKLSRTALGSEQRAPLANHLFV